MNDVTISPAPVHTDWSRVPVESVGAGIERQMVVGEKLMVCRLRFAPEVVTPVHEHPHEQITLVESGQVLFTIEDRQRTARPGDILHFPPGIRHGATVLDEEVVLIDIFSPIREDILSLRPEKSEGDLDGNDAVV